MARVSVFEARDPIGNDTFVWLPVVVWAAVIFLFSTQTFSALNTAKIIDPIVRWLLPAASATTVSLINALVRKCAHFVEYSVLFWLLLRGPLQGRPYVALAACVVYAMLDEGHQIFEPGRTASIYDIALDSTGALFSRFLSAATAELA